MFFAIFYTLYISAIIHIFADNYKIAILMKFDDLLNFLPHDKPFKKELIRTFYYKNGERISTENLNIRVNRLKAKGIIVNVSWGWYRVNDKKMFEPELSPALKKISGKLKKDFPFLTYILWSSSWLNELTTLQLFRNVYNIEVEAGSEESVFRTLKEDFPNRVFLNPNENEWDNYKAEDEENIIVKTMISESPHVAFHGIKIARLEKILVDLYCDKFWKVIFSSEVDNIYSEACSNFTINFSTLLSYAARRGKRVEIWSYIKSLKVLDSSIIKMVEK